MSNTDNDTLTTIRDAMQSSDASVRIVNTFTHGQAAQVYVKTRKVGPFILPTEDQTLGDVFKMLGDMAAGLA